LMQMAAPVAIDRRAPAKECGSLCKKGCHKVCVRCRRFAPCARARVDGMGRCSMPT
jgi:hypothetical protein